MSAEINATAARQMEPTADFQAVIGGQQEAGVLYASRQQAEAAGRLRQKSPGAPGEDARPHSALVSGGTYPTEDGRMLPCTLNGIVEFQVTGFIVVMTVMVGLWLCCSVLHRVLRSWRASEGAPAGSDPDAPVGSLPTPSVEGHGMHPGLSDQQLVVLLAAAAYEVLGRPVRIGSIRQVSPGESNWAAQGRSVLHSHRLN